MLPCANSLDCVNDPLGRTICAPSIGLCVACSTSNDCAADEGCVRYQCVAHEPCVNSLDCPQEEVCDTASGHCVDCLTGSDCKDGEACVSQTCLAACDSDNDCTPSGKLCDFALGACVSCLDDESCRSDEFCELGSCLSDICPADARVCTAGGISGCNSRGDDFLPVEPCAARHSCVVGADGAACEPWVCTPGEKECNDSTTVVVCSDDGFSVVSRTDCSRTDEFCNAGACSDLACAPDSDFCDRQEVRHCDSDGLSSSLVDTCEADEYCDHADPSCKPLVCTPNAPACDGSVAKICNMTGTGFVGIGIDCANSNRVCASGACRTCPGGDGPLDAVRLVEVFIGTNDYVILQNTSSACPVDLSGLQLRASDAEGQADLLIEAYTLDPGDKALVGETSFTAADTVTNGLIDLSTTAGYVLLCAGACTTSGTPTVVDAMSYWDGATAPPAFPDPVTFSPVEGIDISNYMNTAFVRTAFTGTYPDFKASDWTTGAATVEDSSTGTCPATQPTASICTSIGLSCTYGAVSCNCTLYITPLGIWLCS
jgi:hypothetical protein